MTKLNRCERCNVELRNGKCQLASYKRVIDGKEHLFCCVKCAETYERKKKS